MNGIRIEALSGGPTGTRIWVGDRELHEVCDVRFSHAVGDVATVTVDMFVKDKFSFEGIADLHVQAIVLPGYRLVTEERDGKTYYRAEEEAA
jgi:hypothetical protein